MRVLNLTSAQRTHRATRAFVLYESDQSAFATAHPIRQEGGEWRIGPGQCLTKDAVSAALRQLAGLSQKRELLPPHLLYADGARTLWFRPAARRPIFFHTGKAEFDEAVNGKHVLYPALLFLAIPQHLFVWALPSDERPTAATKLRQAPFLNVYEKGHLCAGTMKLPLEVGTDVSVWEKGFFETTFTHSNLRGKLTAHPDGHDGLWRALLDPKLKQFPGKWLRSLPLTAEQALNTGEGYR